VKNKNKEHTTFDYEVWPIVPTFSTAVPFNYSSLGFTKYNLCLTISLEHGAFLVLSHYNALQPQLPVYYCT